MVGITLGKFEIGPQFWNVELVEGELAIDAGTGVSLGKESVQSEFLLRIFG